MNKIAYGREITKSFGDVEKLSVDFRFPRAEKKVNCKKQQSLLSTYFRDSKGLIFSQMYIFLL